MLTLVMVSAADYDILRENRDPLRNPCDLDILLFFNRFPRLLLTSEKLAQYVGYNVKQVGRSLETLIAAGLIRRSLNPSHEARLYVFTADQAQAWLEPVLAAASTREGRTALMGIMKERELAAKVERGRKRGGSGGSHGSAREDPERNRWLNRIL